MATASICPTYITQCRSIKRVRGSSGINHFVSSSWQTLPHSIAELKQTYGFRHTHFENRKLRQTETFALSLFTWLIYSISHSRHLHNFFILFNFYFVFCIFFFFGFLSRHSKWLKWTERRKTKNEKMIQRTEVAVSQINGRQRFRSQRSDKFGNKNVYFKSLIAEHFQIVPRFEFQQLTYCQKKKKLQTQIHCSHNKHQRRINFFFVFFWVLIWF